MVQHRTGVGDGELDHVRAVVVVLVHGGGWLLHRIEEIEWGGKIRKKGRGEGRGELTSPELGAAEALAAGMGRARALAAVRSRSSRRKGSTVTRGARGCAALRRGPPEVAGIARRWWRRRGFAGGRGENKGTMGLFAGLGWLSRWAGLVVAHYVTRATTMFLVLARPSKPSLLLSLVRGA